MLLVFVLPHSSTKTKYAKVNSQHPFGVCSETNILFFFLVVNVKVNEEDPVWGWRRQTSRTCG